MDQRTLGLWIVVLFVAMLVAEIIGKHHRSNTHSTKDRLYALTGLIFQTMITPPLVGAAIGVLLIHVAPENANRLRDVPFWMIFPVWFITEELGHYWLHRWAHEWRWLWKLHRTHHSAPELNVMVIFRYNVFWTFLLPQTWFGTIAVYLGLTEVFVVSALITFIVNLMTHTAYRWDLALRELPGMNAVFNVLEKIVTLPDTHHAHHGMGKSAHMKGNYAVTIFLFDILLGTARIPRRRQEKFGLPGRFAWQEELFWPVFRRRAPAESVE